MTGILLSVIARYRADDSARAWARKSNMNSNAEYCEWIHIDLEHDEEVMDAQDEANESATEREYVKRAINTSEGALQDLRDVMGVDDVSFFCTCS